MAISRKARSRVAFAVAGFVIAVLALLLSYRVMGEAAAHPASSPAAAAAEDFSDDGFPEVDWDYWLSVNGDIVGWISIPGTEVSYPIVQAQPSDPSHYLTHDVYGNVNVYGAVYLDAGCIDKGLDSENAVIFGHHMNDGSMLAAVADYSDEGFMRECGTVQLQTPSRKWTVEVRAAEVCPGWSATKRTAFSDKQDLRAYWEGRMAASLVTRDVDAASPPWKMTTLVTCSYRFTPSDERTLAYCW
jgi:sortase B